MSLTVMRSELEQKLVERWPPKPSDTEWNQYSQLGVEIPHPGKIQASDMTKWVKYGKLEARKRGLKVQE
jgi:hypothetical protein